MSALVISGRYAQAAMHRPGKLGRVDAMFVTLEALGGSETKMTTDPKRKTLQDNRGRDKRRRQEAALDDALKNTFPASDPVSAVQPGRDDPRGSEDGE